MKVALVGILAGLQIVPGTKMAEGSPTARGCTSPMCPLQTLDSITVNMEPGVRGHRHGV